MEAPVAVSKYWDDLKANSPTVVVSRGVNVGPAAMNAGATGMGMTADADGDGDFDLTLLFCIPAGLFVFGLIYACCYEKTTED
jgi:hypothetical protein